MTKWTLAQPDLLEDVARRIRLKPLQRAKALELLQALLMEAMAQPTTTCQLQQLPGASDDEDHA